MTVHHMYRYCVPALVPTGISDQISSVPAGKIIQGMKGNDKPKQDGLGLECTYWFCWICY